jgi:hypothetical protein
MGSQGSREGAWRRLVSCLAAYALALQAILLGVSSGAAAKAAGVTGGFELCLHSSGGSEAADPARDAADTPATGVHCQFCVAGGPAFVAPTPFFVSRTIEFVRRPPVREVVPDLPAAPELACEQPRGPPAA